MQQELHIAGRFGTPDVATSCIVAQFKVFETVLA